MVGLLPLRKLEYDMLEYGREISESEYQGFRDTALELTCSLIDNDTSSKGKYDRNVLRVLKRIMRIHEERLGLVTTEVVDTGWTPTAEFWNAACKVCDDIYGRNK